MINETLELRIGIKNLYTNKLMFSHEAEDNTIRLTMEAAVDTRVDLRGANLEDANLRGANLEDANLRGAKAIYDSPDVLAELAIRFDESLKPVAAMIAGRIIGCWPDYTITIRKVFGDAVIKRLSEAWLQDETWGVRKKLVKHGWIKAIG